LALWNNFDHAFIDDCVDETIEWRKSEEQRKAEEVKEDHESFITANPELVEDIFSSEMAELGFDPSKWRKNGSNHAELVN
jgi:hypothetical protein